MSNAAILTAPWKDEIAGFLMELTSVQEALANMLNAKQALLATRDLAGLQVLSEQAKELMARMQACQAQRQVLLRKAGDFGLPNADLRAVANSLPRRDRGELGPAFKQADSQMRIVRQLCLTNWYIIERTLSYVSYVLEIIATGGRPDPTYDEGHVPAAGGSLLDQAI